MYTHRRAIRELRQMPKIIKADAVTWKQVIAEGVDQMEVYAELCSKIFENENLFSDGITTRARRLRRPLRRLEKNIDIMMDILKILRMIQRRTERMWRRVCLWQEDEHLQQHYIRSELVETLQFLSKRYDYEWEVKEMVVLELECVNNDYDVYMLLEAWQQNRHAAGPDFQAKLRKFFRAMGLRTSTAI